MDDELQPCPFCGGKAGISSKAHEHSARPYSVFWGVCLVCGATGPYALSREEAVRKWNTRKEAEQA